MAGESPTGIKHHSKIAVSRACDREAINYILSIKTDKV